MHAHTIASSSFSIVEYLISVSFNVRDAYATGLSWGIFPCDKTAPNAKLLASVVRMNGFSKSGYCNTGSLIKSFLQVSNDSKNSLS